MKDLDLMRIPARRTYCIRVELAAAVTTIVETNDRARRLEKFGG